MSNTHTGTSERIRGASIGGQVTRQRSIEWQQERNYSSSDDDDDGHITEQLNYNNSHLSPEKSILAHLIAQTQQLSK